MAGSVDYHAAMTGLLLHGFNMGDDPKHFFPPEPPEKVAAASITASVSVTICSSVSFPLSGRLAPVPRLSKLTQR
jgi:hypothetical protein